MQQVRGELDWAILFNALFNEHKLGTDFDIEVSEEWIDLSGSVDKLREIHERFNHIFQTPAAFFQSLPYRDEAHAAMYERPVSSAVPIPDLPESTVPALKAQLISLFGAAALQRGGVSFDLLFNDQATAKDGMLVSYPEKNTLFAELWKNVLSIWIQHFANVDIETVRKAWVEPGISLPSLPDNLLANIDGQGVTAGLAQKCFYVTTNKDDPQNPEVKMRIDVRRLHALIFPVKPVLQIDPQRAVLRIPRTGFMTNLQSILQDGQMLRVYQAQKQVFAQPMVVANELSVPKPHSHTGIFDVSGSMRRDLDTLKLKGIAYFDELRKITPNAQVRLVFFSDNSEVKGPFHIQDKKAIDGAINAARIIGGTALYDMVIKEYENAMKQVQDKTVTMALFTDGDDTGSSASLESVVMKRTAFGPDKPQIYILGYSDVKPEVLTQLGDVYIHLQKVEQFERIYKYLGTMKREVGVASFLYEVNGLCKEFELRIPQDRAPHALQLHIPLHEGQLRLGHASGQLFNVTLASNANVPVKNFVDDISRCVARATDVGASNKSLAVKISEIGNLRGELRVLKSQVPSSQFSLVEQAEGKLHAYLNDLQNAAKQSGALQERMAASVTSMIANDRLRGISPPSSPRGGRGNNNPAEVRKLTK